MGPGAVPFEFLELGIVACKVAVDDHGGLMAGLFMAGLLGGFSHCAGMCGPFVLSQVVTRLEAVPAADMSEMKRLTGAALVPYHLGRMTTYGALGGVAGALAGGFAHMSGLKTLSGVLLMAAAVLFMGYGVKKLGGPFWPSRSGGGFAARVTGLLRPLFARPLGLRGYGLGVVLGFIPCGLLYGALAAAASSGGGVAGALGMVAFAAGTVPVLLAIGWAGHVAGGTWMGAVRTIAPVLLLLNGGVLAYMAWQLLR